MQFANMNGSFTKKSILMSSSDRIKDDKKPSCSLPLFFETDLCAYGPRTGMECMPLRSPPGPYHYHVTDQTKSLQELQNEVGALLEFRDLVIETFPDLKHKMASSAASSTLTGMQTSSLASRREWEPGIRVRRKLMQKENSEISSSSLIRSRSNSHSGKKEPKSGEGNGSVVQDSGFSTETSSSKETHSASSTTGAVPGVNVINTLHRIPIDAEDELWNLLDVIHRKSTRLREEVEYIQNIDKERSRTNSIPPSFLNQLERLSKDDVQILRKERDHLLDKLAEMEAETISSRIRTTKMQDKLDALSLAKREIEEQLKIALSQKIELNTRIHDLHQKYVQKNDSSTTDNTIKPVFVSQTIGNRLNTITSSQGASSSSSSQVIGNRSSFTPVVIKSHVPLLDNNLRTNNDAFVDTKYIKNELNLGHLDGLVSSPNRLIKVRVADSKKITAILLETNPIELQRHLLTVTFQNQVLQQKLEQATKSKILFLNKIDKAKDENEDLRFQLEEKNIELEGTRAQLRVLESRTYKIGYSPEHNRSTLQMSPSRETTLRLQSVSTPSMKAMIPLAMDEILQNSSSTESAQDQSERDRACPETPKRKPSKIPLPGTKGYSAPKPPTGRHNFMSQRSASGPSSNKSLNKSTSSLLGKSESSLIKKDSPSLLNRPDSAQSWRKDLSLINNNNKSSSIPISAKTSPALKPSFSPQPKPKRDSLTSRVRNLDSLSRIQSTTPTGTTIITTSTPTNLYKTNSKKDLSSSFTTGQIRGDRKQIAVPVRRVSSASVGRGTDIQQTDTDNGKNNFKRDDEPTTTETTVNETQPIPSRDLIREYMARTRVPPAIFQPTFNTITTPSDHMDLAYKHPILLIDQNDDESVNEKNKEIQIEYVENNSAELLNCLEEGSNNQKDEISFIIPQSKRNAFSSLTSLNSKEKHQLEETEKPCHLIGKVNPNLIKTWEQLSGSTIKTPDKDKSIEQPPSESSEQQSCVLFYRKPFIFNKEDNFFEATDEKFQVNKILHSESSGDFYDSIDEQSIIENTYVVDDLMNSIYQDSEYVGEGMAECDSLDKKKICWSIENENEHFINRNLDI